MLSIVLRVSACTIGAVFIYAALFLYEDEQRRIQSTLEDWWIRIDEHSHKALSKHTLFMRSIASLASSGFDKLFGKFVVSAKFICASASYSIASFLMVQATYYPLYANVPLSAYLHTFAFSVFFIGLGSLHIWIDTPPAMKTWYVMVFICDFLMIAIVILISGYGQRFITMMMGYVLVGFIFGIVSDALFIIATRRILHWSAGLTSFPKILGVIIAHTMFAFTLVVFPLLLSRWLAQLDYYPNMLMDILGSALILDSYSNLPIVAAASAFILLALGMLLHKVFWPLLNRPIYALQYFGIGRRNKLFGTIGLLLIGSGIGNLPSWLKEVADRLLR